MKSFRNRSLIPSLTIVAVFALGAPVAALCTSLCPIDNHIINFFQEVNCGFFSHTFVQIGIGLFAAFALPLAGAFYRWRIVLIPPGFFLIPYRPPRLYL